MQTTTRSHCPGTFPTETATVAARTAADAAWVVKYGKARGVPDILFGRKGCPECGKAYLPKRDGSLPKHKP